MNQSEEERLEYLLSEILSGRPVQYVLGYTWFHGMKLKVNEHVLIPRRETEELVNRVLTDIRKSGKNPAVVVDFCTGSGCIALALKKELKDTRVIAMDISEDALSVARTNAGMQNLEVVFEHGDVMSIDLDIRPDLIVSNPPYVMESEKTLMHDRVKKHEPSIALFVPEDDPLIFYRHIADWGKKHLISGGKIYFEFNEQMGKQISALHLQMGYRLPVVYKDMQEKDRVFCATKP